MNKPPRLTPPPVYQPPVVVPPTPERELILAGVFLLIGLCLEAVYRPVVPLSYVFQLVPISIAAGIGVAIYQPKIKQQNLARRLDDVGWILILVWCFSQQTTLTPVFLFAVARRLTTAGLLYQDR